MTAYVVVEVDVTDPAQYEEYRKYSSASFASQGVKPIVRGGATTPLEGEPPKRIVILQFDDAAHARRWYDSHEYRQAREVREGAARVRMFIVEGI